MDSNHILAGTKRSRSEECETVEKRQKAEILELYNTKYRIDTRGQGVFTFFRRGGTAPQVRDEVPQPSAPEPLPTAMQQGTHQGHFVGEEDVEMTSELPHGDSLEHPDSTLQVEGQGEHTTLYPNVAGDYPNDSEIQRPSEEAERASHEDLLDEERVCEELWQDLQALDEQDAFRSAPTPPAPTLFASVHAPVGSAAAPPAPTHPVSVPAPVQPAPAPPTLAAPTPPAPVHAPVGSTPAPARLAPPAPTHYAPVLAPVQPTPAPPALTPPASVREPVRPAPAPPALARPAPNVPAPVGSDPAPPRLAPPAPTHPAPVHAPVEPAPAPPTLTHPAPVSTPVRPATLPALAPPAPPPLAPVHALVGQAPAPPTLTHPAPVSTPVRPATPPALVPPAPTPPAPVHAPVGQAPAPPTLTHPAPVSTPVRPATPPALVPLAPTPPAPVHAPVGQAPAPPTLTHPAPMSTPVRPATPPALAPPAPTPSAPVHAPVVSAPAPPGPMHPAPVSAPVEPAPAHPRPVHPSLAPPVPAPSAHAPAPVTQALAPTLPILSPAVPAPPLAHLRNRHQGGKGGDSQVYDGVEEHCEAERAYRSPDEWETRGFQEFEPTQAVQCQPRDNALERELQPNDPNSTSDRVTLSPSELAPSVSIENRPDVLSSELEKWVSSRVNDAKKEARLKNIEAENVWIETQKSARMNYQRHWENDIKQDAEMQFHIKIGTWRDTPELLRSSLKKDARKRIESMMEKFHNESLVHAQIRKEKYQGEVDRVARQARELALEEVKKARESVIASTSSIANDIRQEPEKMQTDDGWLEPEATPSVQKRAKKAASQSKRGHEATARKSSVLSVEPVQWKGKSRAAPSSFEPTHGSLNAASSRAPFLEQPLASQQQEGFDTSFTDFSVEDVDFPMNTTIPTEVASSQAVPHLERPVKDSHCPIDTPEYEAAEERRRQRARHSKEIEEKARRQREDQQRLRDLKDAFSATRKYAQAGNVLFAGMHDMQHNAEGAPAFSKASRQSRTAALANNNALHDSITTTVADANETHIATRDLNITQEQPAYNPGATAGGSSSQTGTDVMLNRVLERLDTTDKRSERIASQVDQLSRVFTTALERGVLGANPATPAQAPPVTPTQPPPVTPSPQPRARRNRPPGTFIEPVPEPQYRPLRDNQFHKNMRSLTEELLLKDTATWPEPPTEDEIETFRTFEDAEDGPTFDNFRLDFSHTPLRDSLWNQRAAEIVVEQYALSYDTGHTTGEVRNEFLKRLDRIRGYYHEYVNSNGAGSTARSRRPASTPENKRQRRGKRVNTLYTSRLTAIESHDTYDRFKPALQQLSRGGMSEDESDHGGECGASQARRFKIVKVQWRSVEVLKWLRTMDLIYTGTKINEDGTMGPGNQFRQRYPSTLENIGSPVKGLPRNFYDERWLRALSPRQREKLCVQPDIDINFSVEERIHASKFIGMKGKLQEARIAGSVEEDQARISHWVLTGNGLWETIEGDQ